MCKLITLFYLFQVLKIMENEKAALKEQIKIDEGNPEVCFIEQAMELLLQREALVKVCFPILFLTLGERSLFLISL